MQILKDKVLTKEQVKQLSAGTEYGVYNPLTDTYKFEKAGKNDIAHLKYAYDGLVYLEVGIETKEEENEKTKI